MSYDCETTSLRGSNVILAKRVLDVAEKSPSTQNPKLDSDVYDSWRSLLPWKCLNHEHEHFVFFFSFFFFPFLRCIFGHVCLYFGQQRAQVGSNPNRCLAFQYGSPAQPISCTHPSTVHRWVPNKQGSRKRTKILGELMRRWQVKDLISFPFLSYFFFQPHKIVPVLIFIWISSLTSVSQVFSLIKFHFPELCLVQKHLKLLLKSAQGHLLNESSVGFNYFKYWLFSDRARFN